MRWLLIPAILSMACGDLGPIRTVGPAPDDLRRYTGDIPPDTGDGGSSGGQTTGDSPPQWPVRINSTALSGDLPSGYPGELNYAGYMNYDAYHARITSTLSITGPDAVNREMGPVEKHTPSFFGNRHSAGFSHYVRSGCGNSIHVDVYFRAWWIGPGGWDLDINTGRIIRKWFQADCQPTGGGGGGPSDGGGGGGDGETWRCYTEYTDHYEYNPNTGETYYLGTTAEPLGCVYLG